jgi:predicted esterase YcpF (UPF0227 family)
MKTFKTIQAISPKQQTWANQTIPLGTILQQVPDTQNRINPIQGIVVDYENESIAIPYSFLEPAYPFKTTILLLHGFNSAPGNKESIIRNWLNTNNLSDSINVVAPQLPYSPNEAIKLIGSLIQEHYGNLVVIGTSLGGFYANYIRAINQTNAIKVNAINPSWSPSASLKKNINQAQENLKTGERWLFTEAYLNYLANFEHKLKDELKQYRGANYSIHLGEQDELLSFTEMVEYLNENKVPFQQYNYPTDHRFGTVEELLENIKGEFIPNRIE